MLQKDIFRHRKGDVDELLNLHNDVEDLGAFGVAAIPEALLERMVMGDPYNCEFAPPGDFRHASCGRTMLEVGVHPSALTFEGNGTAERLNALRLRFPLGSLPCCGTAPMCFAPLCSAAASLVQDSATKVCTKRPSAQTYAYMVHPNVWPAYHGNGGSFDIDVHKHWDVLARLKGLKPADPVFDLAIDLGANTGLVTEKLSMRRFARDYIMVEAVPALKQAFESRLGNEAVRQRWISQQVTTWDGAAPYDPHFEFLNYALSDKTGGFLDTCSFNWQNSTPTTECQAEMANVDFLIPGKLTADFAARFAAAQSAYLKIDVEGMDQLVLNGMGGLLQEKRGDDFLVNFLMLEFCEPCMEAVRKFNNFQTYDLKTLSATLESIGFEAFLMGPRYIPLTHGSWDDAFVTFSKSPENRRCNDARYPEFRQMFPEMFPPDQPCSDDLHNEGIMWTADIFAMRASHPRAAEIKLELGACAESRDFAVDDAQYDPR